MLKIKNLFRILTIFSLWCLTKAEEENKEELSWSNLSFLTSQQTEEKEDKAQDTFDTRPYMLESAEYSEDNLQARTQQRRRKTNLRRRRPEYSDYSSNLNTQIEDLTYYERVGEKEFAPSPSMEISSSDLSASYQAPISGYETPSTSYKVPLSDYETPAYEPLSSSYSSYSKPSYKGPESRRSLALQQDNAGSGSSSTFFSRLLRFLGYENTATTEGRTDTFYDDDDYYSSYGGHNMAEEEPGITVFTGVLKTLLPIGLLISALIPSSVTIHGRKKRETDLNEIEEEYSYPLMTKIGRIGYTGLKKTGCQKRFLCELANLGSTAEANSIQKFAAFAAAATPDVFADYLQAKEVFQAVRVQQCDRFECKGF